MLIPILLVLAFASSGLLAALRPEVWCKYFLAEYERRQLPANLRIVSQLGWAFFAVGIFVAACMEFPTFSSFVWPKLELILPAVVAVAYIWWGRALFFHPERFLAKVTTPFNRTPPLAIKIFGIVLWLGSIGFFCLFAAQIRTAIRNP